MFEEVAQTLVMCAQGFGIRAKELCSTGNGGFVSLVGANEGLPVHKVDQSQQAVHRSGVRLLPASERPPPCRAEGRAGRQEEDIPLRHKDQSSSRACSGD